MSMTQTDSAPEARAQLPRLGIRRALLTDEIFQAVVGIYYEVARGETADPESLVHGFSATDVDRLDGAHYRLGSTLNRHSQLYALPEGEDQIVDFYFYPNHQNEADEHPGTPAYAEGRVISEAFNQRVGELLLSLGVAESIEL